MRGQLSPDLADFIDSVNKAIAQAKQDGVVPSPELAREKLAALSAFNTNIPEITFSEVSYIDSPDATISVRVYSPAPNEKLPVIIFFHGGGHMCGDSKLYEPMCIKMANSANSVVISVDYRLSPEFPYPCGLNDAEFVVKNYESLLTGIQFDASQLAIAGDSAGGAICTSLTMRQLNDKSLKFNKQILIYPSVDYTMSMPSVKDNGIGFFLEQPRVQWYFDNYFLNNEDRKQASALFNPVDSGSPSSLVIVAGCDPLRDEGLAYADKLKEQGVQVEVKRFDNMIHAFMNIEDLVPKECAELYQAIGSFIKGR